MSAFYVSSQLLEQDYHQTIIKGGPTIMLNEAEDIGKLLGLLDELGFEQSLSELAQNPIEFAERLNAVGLGKVDEALSKTPDFDKDSDFITALRIAYKVWKNQGSDGKKLHLAIAVPTAPMKEQIEYISSTPALAFHPGSLKIVFTSRTKRVFHFLCNLLSFFTSSHPWAKALYALKGATWFIAFLLEPKQAPEQAIKTLLATVHIGDDPLPWTQLENCRPEDLKDKRGLIILLHGVFSTIGGTFEGFHEAWSKQLGFCKENQFAKLAWPHDSLACIDKNAEELCQLILKKTSGATTASNLPIFFVCHSRGGLLARRTAVSLKQKNYFGKLGCLTFGTPHEGSALADCVPEEFAGMLYAMAASVIITSKRPIALFQVLRYYWGGGDFCGVENLMPKGSGALKGKKTFIEKLEALEESGRYRIPVFAVSGEWNPDKSDMTKVFDKLTHKLLGSPSDGVVTVISAKPQGYDGYEKPLPCFHTEYFEQAMQHEVGFYAALLDMQRFFDCATLPPPSPPEKFKYKIVDGSVYLVIGGVRGSKINRPIEQFRTWDKDGVQYGSWENQGEAYPLEE